MTTWLILGAAVASAQAPPDSFFEGRSAGELRALARDPHNDVLVRRIAASKLVAALADRGDFDGTDAAIAEFSKNIDPRAVTYARAVRRRRTVHAAAVIALGGVSAVAGMALLFGRKKLAAALPAVRSFAPGAAAFMLFAGLGGGSLAASYENGTPLPFWLFAVAMLPLVVVFRAWSAIGSSRAPARIARTIAALTATFALGFLVVEYVSVSFLQGFGL